MQTTASAGLKAGEQHPRDIFRDRTVSAEEIRLFGILCSLAQGPGGCFAPRTVLARMTGRSVSSVNHQLASLKRRGYITISRKGRRSGARGIVRVLGEAREESGFTTTGGRRRR